MTGRFRIDLKTVGSSVPQHFRARDIAFSRTQTVGGRDFFLL